MTSLRKSFISGFFWSILGQGGHLLIYLFASIILARILTPYEFGQIGIVMFFINISRVFTESGLSGALIRKQDATEDDFSTVFVFNLVISVLLTVGIIAASGPISEFYNNNDLQSILIALSFVLIINAFQFTQNAKIVKNLKFRRQAIYNFSATLVSSAAAVVLAYLGFGVWSLVIMQLLNAAVLTTLYWVFEGPSGQFLFKSNSFRQLYKFGLYTTLASLINTAFDNIYSLVLGKYFAIQQTGLYYQAKKLQEIPVNIIKSSTLGVVFSTLSRLQNSRKEFDDFYTRIVTSFTVLVGLICILIYIYAEQAILLLYGEQWVGAVFYMKILVLGSFFYMQEMFNRVLFKVFDKTEKILTLEIIKVAIRSISIVYGVVEMDIIILLYGFLVTSIISYFINYFYSRKVYRSFSWEELITTIKVAATGGFVIYVYQVTGSFLEVSMWLSFSFLPLILLIYFVLLRVFKVFNVIGDTKVFLKVIKKK